MIHRFSYVKDNIKEALLSLPVSPQQNWVMKINTLHSEIKHGFYMVQQHEILFFWRWFFFNLVTVKIYGC